MNPNRHLLPIQTAGLYILYATAWIVFSDLALEQLIEHFPSWRHMETLKGVIFVLVTAGLLYVLLKRMVYQLDRAETELLLQEDRWRLAVDSVGDGVWEADIATKQVYFSHQWKAMLGYEDHEIDSAPEEWLSRIHPDDRVRTDAEMQRYLAGECASYRCEFRMLAKDGSYRWILARGSLITPAGENRATRMIGTHTDITAQKEIEVHKADALALTNAVLQSSPAGIVVYRADGTTVSANESAARVAGTDLTTLLGINFRQLESWKRSGLLAAADAALAADHEVVFNGPITTIFGRSLWLESRLIAFNYKGAKHLLVMLHDVTVQQRTLENLHLLEAAVKAAPVGWMVTDADGRIESVNPAFTQLTGYPPEETIGKTPRILKSGRHDAAYYRALWDAITRGEVWSGTMVNRRRDGSFYHELNTISPIRRADGTITHFVAIKQDITGQKELEHQLARSQRMESIGLLATGLVHDLNNMLSPIMLALGLIRARHPDRETISNLQLMESAAQRGAGVLRQVLTFARGVEGERTELEPRTLLKEIAALARETFPREIRVVVAIAADVQPVRGDLTQLHQVLLNLSVNARDAMPQGGVLTLHAENVVIDEARASRQVMPAEPGNYVLLGVRDTGTGIGPEVLEHMFEPFFTTKPRGKGTGLGLSTVFGIVRSHEGFIEVTSELGRGTDLCVLLPAVARADADAARAAPAPGVLLGRGRSVLIVDDEATIRGVMSHLLERRGFRTVEARDGVDGLAKFKANPEGFSAVLLDLMMPGMNGYKLAQEIRALAPRLPIIASTGMSGNSPSDDGDAVLRGMNVHTLLRKPYSEEIFLEALRRELEAGEAAAPSDGAGL